MLHFFFKMLYLKICVIRSCKIYGLINLLSNICSKSQSRSLISKLDIQWDLYRVEGGRMVNHCYGMFGGLQKQYKLRLQPITFNTISLFHCFLRLMHEWFNNLEWDLGIYGAWFYGFATSNVCNFLVIRL